MSRFKRYLMEIDLRDSGAERGILPFGYRWQKWSAQQLAAHAQVTFESFRREPDCILFPNLGRLAGCEQLMNAMTAHRGFLPGATWLVEHCDDQTNLIEPCGCIQGLFLNSTTGAIQNVGVLPTHRQRGLGRALMLKALRGFRAQGLLTVSLEVTAENDVAVQLYRSLGFRPVRILDRSPPPPGM